MNEYGVGHRIEGKTEEINFQSRTAPEIQEIETNRLSHHGTTSWVNLFQVIF